MNKCPKCGAQVFKAIPGKTTEAEIVEFARHCRLPDKEVILQEKWIHPGEYCPHGCTLILHDHGYSNYWQKWAEEFEQTHTCNVTIIGTDTLPLPLSEYKIYVDGNIERTRREEKEQGKQPKNGEFVRLTPGDHRIVICEGDVKKPGRLESNTIWFTAADGDTLHFEAGVGGGKLVLTMQ